MFRGRSVCRILFGLPLFLVSSGCFEPPLGMLDATFGKGGMVLGEAPGIGGMDSRNRVQLVIDHTSDVYYVIGQSKPSWGSIRSLTVWKYTSDGTLDSSFHGSGKRVFLYFAEAGGFELPWKCTVEDAVLGANGSLYIASWVASPVDSFTYHMVTWNITPEGELNSEFGSEGIVEGPNKTRPKGITRDSQGHVYAAGYGYADSWDASLIVWKYSAQGALITAAEEGDYFILCSATEDWGCYGIDIAVDGSNRVYVAANRFNPATEITEMGVLRYSSEGTPDSSFGMEGGVWYAYQDKSIHAAVLAMDAWGRIYLAGYEPYAVRSHILRLHSDGTPDLQWNKTGVLIFTSPSGNSVGYAKDQIRDIFPYANGKLIATGKFLDYQKYQTNIDTALWSFDETGTLDPSFGTNGMVVTVALSDKVRKAWGDSLAMSTDGRILVAGRRLFEGVGYRMTLYAYR